MQRRIWAFLVAVLAGGTSAQAEVKSATDVGFAVENSVEVAQQAHTVYSLVATPARWWSSEHSFSGDASNLVLEPRTGGCFCERLPGSGMMAGSVENARIIFAEPYKRLRLSGALGPLQSEAVTGTLDITLTPVKNGVKVVMSYVAAGYMRMDPAQIAPIVDKVLAEQLARLKRLAEQGR